MPPLLQRIFIVALLLFCMNPAQADQSRNAVFGFQEIIKTDLSLFPQWRSVLERHQRTLEIYTHCSPNNQESCLVSEWLSFLRNLEHQSAIQKIRAVNDFANQRQYVLDKENYGEDDYWATPAEFLLQNGDCEDYAIIKMLSLKQLGFDVRKMRVVVVQDTNLRIPHAVMAIELGGDILILDNQIREVISHEFIYHYVPVYSISEVGWWMHLPK